MKIYIFTHEHRNKTESADLLNIIRNDILTKQQQNLPYRGRVSED